MKNKKFVSILAGIMAAVMLLTMIMSILPAIVGAAESSSAIREQINEMEAQQAALEQQYAALQEQYKANENEMLDMVSQKNVIDQEIANLTAQIELINGQISAYNLMIADKQDELDAAQWRLVELNAKNKERIRAMEEEGNLSYWSVLFKANSFADLLDRLAMIEEIAAADQRRLDEMSEAAKVVAEAMSELETQKAEQELIAAELETAMADMEEKRVEADELLLQLVAKGAEYETLMDEGEAAQEALLQEIAQAEKEFDQAKYREWLATSVAPTTKPASGGNSGGGNSGGSGGSGSGSGSGSGGNKVSSSGWLTPVSGYRITSPFGMRLHPVHGYYRMHNGVDLACAQGTPIYASRSGQVTVAKYGTDAGYYVSINHGDGFASVYMHMTHYVVGVGQYVSQGQLIGYVGSTGASTGAHLHFGISYNGSYVNPMKYVG